MTQPSVSRRTALAAAAALPAALPMAAALAPRPAAASADMMGAAMPNYFRFPLGQFEVTTLLVGSMAREDPHSIFGLNVEDDRFQEVSRQNFIPADRAQFFFTPTVVNTGQELILFDTGLDPTSTLMAMQAAGYAPDDVDRVVITHMHGDHIGGLMADGGETFEGADYVTGRVEAEYWAEEGGESYDAKVAPIVDRFSLIEDGASVASGITAMAAFGHTPGHMAYMIESDGQQLLIFADTANHYVYSLAYPDWEVSFDVDSTRAAETRRRILDMLATDRVPFIGYHMPFPAIGFVEAREDGFRWVPESYQMRLG